MEELKIQIELDPVNDKIIQFPGNTRKIKSDISNPMALVVGTDSNFRTVSTRELDRMLEALGDDGFGDAFMIDSPPFLLRENIRNTSNIYSYAMENTKLGTDVIRNPVEGPIPTREKIRDRKHLNQRLENLLKEFIVDEELRNDSLVILFENEEDRDYYLNNGLAQWCFTECTPTKENEIKVSSAFDYKGLEADMVIYVRSSNASENINYIAYTRAKYYLYELIK